MYVLIFKMLVEYLNAHYDVKNVNKIKIIYLHMNISFK